MRINLSRARSRAIAGPFFCMAVAAALVWCLSFTSTSRAQQAANSIPATYVTTAEIDAALAQMPPNTNTYDKPIKTVDAGAYKVTIVILRRVPGKTPDSSLLHDRVTEVYQILTGAGMFETGGTLVDGHPVDLTSEAAGPSIRGTIQGGESRRMGPGDVVVIPPGIPHRFSKLEGTITYLVTRIEAPRSQTSKLNGSVRVAPELRLLIVESQMREPRRKFR